MPRVNLAGCGYYLWETWQGSRTRRLQRKRGDQSRTNSPQRCKGMFYCFAPRLDEWVKLPDYWLLTLCDTDSDQNHKYQYKSTSKKFTTVSAQTKIQWVFEKHLGAPLIARVLFFWQRYFQKQNKLLFHWCQMGSIMLVYRHYWTHLTLHGL